MAPTDPGGFSDPPPAGLGIMLLVDFAVAPQPPGIPDRRPETLPSTILTMLSYLPSVTSFTIGPTIEIAKDLATRVPLRLQLRALALIEQISASAPFSSITAHPLTLMPLHFYTMTTSQDAFTRSPVSKQRSRIFYHVSQLLIGI
ncbi:hypothetical protein FB45DRAFT_1037633 [Roridomyces roridus]|uniref:Uncharacterized protein n=1 Tax=Roridomyces roridus TaxID=1738132 RepID=A0AAD7B6J9_9AGAR|nr:hypothetical protein FB45DRAFT_1037633 [Roridomyces roridus]